MGQSNANHIQHMFQGEMNQARDLDHDMEGDVKTPDTAYAKCRKCLTELVIGNDGRGNFGVIRRPEGRCLGTG